MGTIPNSQHLQDGKNSPNFMTIVAQNLEENQPSNRNEIIVIVAFIIYNYKRAYQLTMTTRQIHNIGRVVDTFVSAKPLKIKTFFYV